MIKVGFWIGLQCTCWLLQIFVGMKKKWMFSRKLLYVDLSIFALGLLIIVIFWCWILLYIGICILVCHVAIWGLFKFGFLPFLLLCKSFWIVATTTMARQGVAWWHFARFASSNFFANSFCDVIIVVVNHIPISSFHSSLALLFCHLSWILRYCRWINLLVHLVIFVRVFLCHKNKTWLFLGMYIVMLIIVFCHIWKRKM